MKKLVFLMFAFIIASTSQAQIGKEFYNKYSDAKGVQTTYISPSMFKQMDQEALNIQCDNISLKFVHGMYVIDCDDPATIKRIKKDIDLKLSQNEFELMIESKDGDDCSRIYMAKKEMILLDWLFFLKIRKILISFSLMEALMKIDSIAKSN